jgi:hypothetical protein
MQQFLSFLKIRAQGVRIGHLEAFFELSEDLAPQPLVFIQQRYVDPGLGGFNGGGNPAGPAADNDKIAYFQFSRFPVFKTFLGFNPAPGSRKGLAGLGIGDAVYRHAAFLTQSDAAIKAPGLFEFIGIAKRSATSSQQRCSDGLALVCHDLFPIYLYFKRPPSFDTLVNASFTLGHMLPFLCLTA